MRLAKVAMAGFSKSDTAHMVAAVLIQLTETLG